MKIPPQSCLFLCSYYTYKHFYQLLVYPRNVMQIQANICVFIFLLLFCFLLFFFNKISLKSFYISSQNVSLFFTHLHGKWRHFDLNGRKHNTDVNQITSVSIFYGTVSMSWFFMSNNDNSYNLRSLPLSTMCYVYYFMPSS